MSTLDFSKAGDGGCPKCGLFGCSCDITESFDNSLCKKCKAAPCECGGKPMKRTMGERDVCTVCRRQQLSCICKSHATVRHVHNDPHVDALNIKRPYTDAHIDVLCNEALAFYYSRDADGLQRWLRRVFR